MELNAYDKIDVSIMGTVDNGGSAVNETVQLIPVATNDVKCLVIQASHYDNDLSYEVSGAGTTIVLDSPQSFIGEGAVSSLAVARLHNHAGQTASTTHSRGTISRVPSWP